VEEGVTRRRVLEYAGARTRTGAGPADWRFRTVLTALFVLGLCLFGGGIVALFGRAGWRGHFL
jgi:hypothetical protein